jgi:nucleolar protein 56
MRLFLLANEQGLALFAEGQKPISKYEFAAENRAKHFLDASSGFLSDSEFEWVKASIHEGDILYVEEQFAQPLRQAGLRPELLSDDQQREFNRKKIDLLVLSGLASSKEQAERVIRDVSLELSAIRIKEMSSKPDLQAMESVQALDEIDKTANIVSSRVREWYGLHFPELVSIVDDNISLVKLVLTFKSRSNYDESELEKFGYSKNKSKAIMTAAEQSRGAELREDDLSRIVLLAEEAQHLFSLRDKLATHVEKTMRQVAPNVSEVAGASIGARLIAKAGGLERLSVLPASTIQILGAEKALYRALKSGSRPPKHGILFQHAAVHSAPKWQRGKIARSLAGKIAIAARVDHFRGAKEDLVMRSLQTRLDEIKVKYKDAPKERPQFVPQRRAEYDTRPRREEGHGKRRDFRKSKKSSQKGPNR